MCHKVISTYVLAIETSKIAICLQAFSCFGSMFNATSKSLKALTTLFVLAYLKIIQQFMNMVINETWKWIIILLKLKGKK